MAVGAFFTQESIKTYKEKLHSHEETIKMQKKTISEQLEVIKSKKIEKNVKTITIIAPDGSQRIEQIDLSKEESGELSKSNSITMESLKESTEKTLKREIESTEHKNPKSYWLGLGYNNDKKKEIHFIKTQGSFGVGAYTQTDFKKYGAQIFYGF